MNVHYGIALTSEVHVGVTRLGLRMPNFTYGGVADGEPVRLAGRTLSAAFG